MRFLKILVISVLGVLSPILKAEENDIRVGRKVTIPRLVTPPTIESFLTMNPRDEVAESMATVEGFIQRSPRDGQPSSQRTQVYMGYDDKSLYVVFLAFDSEPEKVRARMNRRENVFNDDIVEIMIDTFQDQRRAYAFVANPLGVQWDALWTEGQGFDDSFDTLWYSKGELTDQGYVVLMTIPFKSLRFPSTPEQTWGFILIREIQRGSAEQSSWPHVSVKLDGRLNQAATLKGLKNISPGRNAQLIPYGTFRSFRLLNPAATGPRFRTESADTDVGLDGKLVFSDNMVLDGTINPDFSQVESDEPQVTVNQRFEVFFPEKRPFFLENANFFFSPINLVFTRRIADPQFGLRLTGKAGPYAIGAIAMDDEAPGKGSSVVEAARGKRAFFSILRVSRDILRQSTLGLIFTDREFRDGYNRVGGVDGRIKLNQNWISTFQGVLSATKRLDGQKLTGPAFDARLDRNGRKFNYHLHYTDIHPDFRTQTGFVRRSDMRNIHQFVSHRFRPEKKFLISWGPELFIGRTWDYNGSRLDREYNTGISFNVTGSTNFGVFYSDMRELLRPEDFSVLTENRDFSVTSTQIFFETDVLKEVTFEGSFSLGQAINFVPPQGQTPSTADRQSTRLELNFRPNTRFRIDNRYILTQLHDRRTDGRIFDNHIVRSRWNWQYNRKLSLRLILQYEATLADEAFTVLSTTKNFNVDFLFTYLVNPWTALYVGVNSNYQNLAFHDTGMSSNLIRTGNSFMNDSRQVFVKYSYLFRF